MTLQEQYDALDAKMKAERETCTTRDYFEMHLEKMKVLKEIENANQKSDT